MFREHFIQLFSPVRLCEGIYDTKLSVSLGKRVIQFATNIYVKPVEFKLQIMRNNVAKTTDYNLQWFQVRIRPQKSAKIFTCA